jgi:iron-sulfur cluster assembly protein
MQQNSHWVSFDSAEVIMVNISLTQSAATHIRQMLQQRGHGIGLRIGTRKSGCSGFAYDVDYADDIRDNDVVIESSGVTVVVDKDSIPLLDGMQLDYVRNNVLNQGFEFSNPNVKETCGCGESFNV